LGITILRFTKTSKSNLIKIRYGPRDMINSPVGFIIEAVYANFKGCKNV